MLRAAGLTHARISKVNQPLVSLFTNMMKCVLALAMPQLVLWFLLTPALVLSQPLPTVSHMAPSPMPAPRPGCPIMCGGVPIPCPFGIGEDHAGPGLDDFTLTCNHIFNPPRPYLGNTEIIDISVEAGEIRVVTPVSFICYNSNTTIESNGTAWKLDLTNWRQFLISPKRNEFTVIGCYTLAYLEGRDDWSYSTGCITTCRSLESAANDGDPCTGLGCCQMPSIPSNISTIAVQWGINDCNGSITVNPAWSYSPCSYAFVAEKGWYNFSRKDLNGTSDRRVSERSIPMVLDWAITSNGTCPPLPAKPVAPACVSTHSYCVNAIGRQGYRCNCSDGYSGNPYDIDGCTNINECELRKSDPKRYENQYPCKSGSTCRDTEGGYECKCNFWLRGDGKTKGCRPIFPTPVVAIVATVCAIVLLGLLGLLLWFIRREHKREHKRRQLRGFFDRHGGQILKSMNINIFTKEQLDKITQNYSTTIGNGSFGMVYMGTTDDNQQVAVKRSIVEGETRRQDDFVNEITIQFRISHLNLVRLIGCCLETEVPMLVFEFITNGSLYHVLHGAEKRNVSLLVRLDIAIGSAEALAYLHSHGGHNIVHGDVKSGNILLDGNFMPKVSDFGSSKPVSVTRYANWSVTGDTNYIDPVYINTGRFMEKSDVYSFGVVLLELITRKKARYEESNSLPINFKSYKDKDTRRAMYDIEILSNAPPRYMECLDKIGDIAARCLKEDRDERPTMTQVVDELKLAKLRVRAAEVMGN